MYLPFVMWGYAAALALLLVACNVIPRSIPGLRGIRELSWALALAILSVVLLGLRPWAPALLTILVANAALYASFLLIYRTTAVVLRQDAPFLGWGVGLCIAVLPAFGYYTWVRPDIVPRILLSSGVLAVVAFWTGLLLFRHRSADLGYSARTVAGFQVSAVALHVVRCILTVLYPPRDFVHLGWIQTGFSYGQLILGIAMCCGIIWLSVCEHRSELERMALTDPLTRLLNRRAFEEVLGRQMERCRRSGATLGLILVDLDHFKEINDRHGHFVGDEVIRRVSGVLIRITRPLDALARYGGEEFAVLLPDVGEEQAEQIAERLRAEIEQLSQDAPDMKVTASIGAAIRRSAETPSEFLERCDEALYRSKRAGRNLVTISSSASDRPSLAV